MDLRMAQALVRFGLGRRGTDPLPADPMAWLSDQAHSPDDADFTALPPTSACLKAWRLDTTNPLPPTQTSRVQAILRAEKIAQTNQMLMTDASFRERMVRFWSNHFTVSLARIECYPVAGAFVREAIRPHVFGRFHDMLLAVMRHPAMLLYLDNTTSYGPHSPVGQRTGLGLNENLARECLELHTVSPDSGYTQTDVTEFAKVITGWTIDFAAADPDFAFDPSIHEPGPKRVMGRTYPPGEVGGTQALAFLAEHPSTYRFLAIKLVRHFVADDPPPADVKRIARVLHDTHGDLAAASVALTHLPGAWIPLTKLRSPQDYVTAVARAVALPPNTNTIAAEVMDQLGQPLWTAPLPNGWPDRAANWAGPEALLRRAEWANRLAGRLDVARADPDAVAEASIGPLLDPATLQQMHGAGSRRSALTLLMASPEFLRR